MAAKDIICRLDDCWMAAVSRRREITKSWSNFVVWVQIHHRVLKILEACDVTFSLFFFQRRGLGSTPPNNPCEHFGALDMRTEMSG